MKDFMTLTFQSLGLDSRSSMQEACRAELSLQCPLPSADVKWLFLDLRSPHGSQITRQPSGICSGGSCIDPFLTM